MAEAARAREVAAQVTHEAMGWSPESLVKKITDALERYAQEREARAHQALAPFLQHKYACSSIRARSEIFHGKCDCGLFKAVAALPGPTA